MFSEKSFLLSDLLDLYKLHCDQCLFLQSMLSALIVDIFKYKGSLINNQFLYFGSGCLMWIGTAFDTDITSGASMGYRLLKEGQIIPH